MAAKHLLFPEVKRQTFRKTEAKTQTRGVERESLSIYLDGELAAKIRSIAQTNDLAVSAVCATFIKRQVAQIEAELGGVIDSEGETLVEEVGEE